MGVSALTMTAAFQSSADSARAAGQDKSYTGMVTSIDPQERTLSVHGMVLNRNFNLGDTCGFATWDKPDAGIKDVRTGEKVTVNYQNVGGILVADRVEQRAMAYEGTVSSFNPAAHQLTLGIGAREKIVQVPEGCKVVLRNDRTGTLSDVQPGNHVTVIYELPGSKPVARQIAQTSARFTGTVTAVDLRDRTINAQSALGAKRFHLADNCTWVMNGQMSSGETAMNHLALGENLSFSYEDVNGVNIVNRIGAAPAAQTSRVTTPQPMIP